MTGIEHQVLILNFSFGQMQIQINEVWIHQIYLIFNFIYKTLQKII